MCLTFRSSAIFQQQWRIFLYCSFSRIILQNKKSRKEYIKASGIHIQDFRSRWNCWIHKCKHLHTLTYGLGTKNVKTSITESSGLCSQELTWHFRDKKTRNTIQIKSKYSKCWLSIFSFMAKELIVELHMFKFIQVANLKTIQDCPYAQNSAHNTVELKAPSWIFFKCNPQIIKVCKEL